MNYVFPPAPGAPLRAGPPLAAEAPLRSAPRAAEATASELASPPRDGLYRTPAPAWPGHQVPLGRWGLQ